MNSIKAEISAVMIKAKLLTVLTIVFAFLAPIKMLLLCVGAAIFADTVMGIYRSKRQKQKVTSRKLFGFVRKNFVYLSAVILTFILEKHLLGEFVKLVSGIDLLLTKLMAILLVSIEVKSIDESYNVIFGHSLFDKLKSLIRSAKKVKNEINELKEDSKDEESDNKSN